MNKTPSHHPRWLYQVFRLVDSIPVPGWLIAAFSVVLIALGLHLLAWGSGQLGRGQINPYFATPGFYLVLIPACWTVLTKRASQDLRKFFLGSDKGERQIREVVANFNSLPEGTSLLLLATGIVLGYFSYRLIGFPTEPILEEALPGILAFTYFYSSSLGLLLFARAIRQATLVHRLYSRVEVDLFKRGPIYALSSYGGFASVILFTLFYFLTLISFPGFVVTPYGVLIQAFLLLIIALLFFVPLSGINRRMKDAKEEMLASANEDLRDLREQIHAAAQAQDYAKVDTFQGALATLQATREMIDAVPTWPWQANTLRNLFVPLILPVIVFLIQSGIERVIGG